MRSGVTTRWVGTAMVVLGLGGGIARGDEDAELRELKETVRGMQQTIEKLNEKIERMERERTEKAAAPAPTPETGHAENVIAPQGVGPQATPMAGVVIAPPPINEEAAEGNAENVISNQGIGPQAPIDPKLRGFFQRAVHEGDHPLQRQAARRLHLRHPEPRRRQPLRHRARSR